MVADDPQPALPGSNACLAEGTVMSPRMSSPDLTVADAPAEPASNGSSAPTSGSSTEAPMRSLAILTNMADPGSLPDDFPAYASAAEVMACTGGNTGNVAFVAAIQKLIGGQHRHLGWDDATAASGDGVEAVVICCANQLGSHCDLGGLVPYVEAWDRPVVLIGLGAQASSARERPDVPAGTLTFLRACSERRPGTAINISVRGEFSRQCLEAIGIESVVSGCPSTLLSPDPQLGASIADRVAVLRRSGLRPRLATAAGNPWDTESFELESRLLILTEEFHGDYIIQHPDNLLKIVLDPEHAPLDEIGQLLLERYAPSLGGPVEARRWLRRHGSIHVRAGSWMTALRRFDGVLGMRFHGVALGVQAGISGLVITIDSRTEELCEQAGIPCLSVAQASELNPPELAARSLWSQQDGERFDRVRAGSAQAMQAFLQANRLPISHHFASLLAAIAPAHPQTEGLSR